MAVAGIFIKGEIPELEDLQKGLRALADKKTNALILKEALEKAIWPAFLRLREITPVGPTGNLRRAVGWKAKAYPRNGGAVGLVGYRRSGKAASQSAQGGTVQTGPDRAFHQWFVEYGTQPRQVSKFANAPYQRVSKNGVVHWVSGQNAYIASSYNKLGKFDLLKSPNGRVQTDPAYPKAFFRKSKTPIVIPPMPAGGTQGVPPVQTAFRESQSKVAFILQQELRISLERAAGTLAIRDKTISGY